MKKTLLNLAFVATLASASAQGIAPTAAWDDFKDANSFVAGNTPYSIITNETYWNDTTKQSVPGRKAYMGIFWWTDAAKNDKLDFDWVRNDGKLSYTNVEQGRSKYEPLGVGFGSYAFSATEDTLFTLDLSNNKKLSISLTNTSVTDMEFRVGLQDINGNLLNGFQGVANEPAAVYKYEILFNLPASGSKTFEFDFDTASYIYYTTLTPNATDECENQGFFKTKAESGFDFTKVKAVVLTPLNATGTGVGDFPDCWGKVALTGGSFDVTEFKLGDVSVGVSDELVATFSNETVSVYNFSGALVAQGKADELNLSSGLYILKSASKSVKIFVK